MNDLSQARKLIKECRKTQNPYLDLGNCGITDLSELPELFECTHLETLILSNEWYDAKDDEYKSSNSGKDNKISSIPKEISKLKQLTKLNICGYYDSKWEISDLGFLSNLTGLQTLYLYNNQISDIRGLENLTGLQELDLRNNQISDIRALENLTGLQSLDLSNNQLIDIKALEKILQLKDFKELTIDNNPFLQQESLILESNKNHKDDILKYLSDIDEKQSKKAIALPVKIMFFGNHASGKTTFLHYLLHDTLPDDPPGSTHVLNVHRYPVHQQNNEVLPQAMIYDFGGQDYYHGIYRAFFSVNSISLLFWCSESNKNDVRKARDNTDCDTCDFTWNYWLFQLNEVINRLKKDDTKEPLFLVQTHSDIPDNKEETNFGFLNGLTNFEIKKKRFITLKKTDDETFILKKNLLKILKDKRTPQAKPVYYEEFLNYVLTFQGEEYVRIKEDILDKGYYKRKPIKNETSDEMLTYLKADLNQLFLKGIVLYYRDSPIDDIVWLNSAKTIEYIYRDILSKNIIDKYKGVISENDFDKLWQKSETKEPDKIRKERFERIKELLKNEKIVFHDNSKKQYIIPSFLPLSSEDKLHGTLSGDFDKQEDISFILKFRNFIPFGLINELICLYGNLPDDKYYWRDQFIFRFDSKYKVWIKFNFPQLSIEVYIIQNNKESELKLNEVRKAIFLNIIDLYQGNRVPMINNEDVSKFSEQVKHYIQTKEQQEIEYPKDMYISIGGGIYVKPIGFDKNPKYVPAYELIDSGEVTRAGEKIEIVKEESTITGEIVSYKDFINTKNIRNMKKIFFSYAHEDEEIKKLIEKQLASLKRLGKIEIWDDGMIKPGQEWNEAIKSELEEADIILLFVSPSFNDSDFIWDVELKKAIERHEKGECVVIPIFARKCDFKDMPYAKLQGLPNDCRFIFNAPEKEQDDLCVEIAKGIRRIIDE